MTSLPLHILATPIDGNTTMTQILGDFNIASTANLVETNYDTTNGGAPSVSVPLGGNGNATCHVFKFTCFVNGNNDNKNGSASETVNKVIIPIRAADTNNFADLSVAIFKDIATNDDGDIDRTENVEAGDNSTEVVINKARLGTTPLAIFDFSARSAVKNDLYFCEFTNGTGAVLTYTSPATAYYLLIRTANKSVTVLYNTDEDGLYASFNDGEAARVNSYSTLVATTTKASRYTSTVNNGVFTHAYLTPGASLNARARLPIFGLYGKAQDAEPNKYTISLTNSLKEGRKTKFVYYGNNSRVVVDWENVVERKML